jgi:hypothetical protein
LQSKLSIYLVCFLNDRQEQWAQGSHGMICIAKSKGLLHMMCLLILSSDGGKPQNGQSLDEVLKGQRLGATIH